MTESRGVMADPAVSSVSRKIPPFDADRWTASSSCPLSSSPETAPRLRSRACHSRVLIFSIRRNIPSISCRHPLIMMMESTHFREGDDRALTGDLHRSPYWTIHGQRQMRPPPMERP